MYFFVA